MIHLPTNSFFWHPRGWISGKFHHSMSHYHILSNKDWISALSFGEWGRVFLECGISAVLMLSSTFLNIWIIFVIAVLMLFVYWFYHPGHFLGIIFLLIRGCIFRLLCMPDNLLLDARHCKFYLVECWIWGGGWVHKTLCVDGGFWGTVNMILLRLAFQFFKLDLNGL